MLNSPTLPHEVPTSQAVFRRIGLRTVPLLFACYVVNMLDRLNVGFAKLQFLADLHLNEAVFGVAAGFLYLGYIPFEVPSNLMLHRYGARKTLLRIMILWGVFTMVQALASGKYQFYALRYLVGAAEVGFFPGVLLYFKALGPVLGAVGCRGQLRVLSTAAHWLKTSNPFLKTELLWGVWIASVGLRQRRETVEMTVFQCYLGRQRLPSRDDVHCSRDGDCGNSGQSTALLRAAFDRWRLVISPPLTGLRLV
jgi:hypothetical protein